MVSPFVIKYDRTVIEARLEGDCAMSRMTRRVFVRTTSLAAGAATFGILTRRGDAAEFSWRYGNELVPTHSICSRQRNGFAATPAAGWKCRFFPITSLAGGPTCCRSCAPA